MQVIVCRSMRCWLEPGKGMGRVDVSCNLLLAKFHLSISHGALFTKEMTFCALEHVFLHVELDNGK